MAPVVRALSGAPDLEVRLVSTGQHREMLATALADLELVPDRDLALMRPGQSPSDLVAVAVSALAEDLGRHRPELVIVHGDTGSALAGALAAFLARIPLAHVEAGLRSGDLARPFPEEGNRRVVDTLASLLWAPTREAEGHLVAEGLGDRTRMVTGNTVIDSLYWARDRARGALPPGIPAEGPLVLVTAHRRESFGEPFRDLCHGILRIVEEHPGVRVAYPVHRNPEVVRPVEELLSGHDRIHLIPPQGYLPFVALMDRATLVLTDSGGIQEEAPALGKPVLVMRETTERPEAVAAGTVKLVGTDPARIAEEAGRLLGDPDHYRAMATAVNPYGDGRAAWRIRESVRAFFGMSAQLEPFQAGD